jgi:hypothetical protein
MIFSGYKFKQNEFKNLDDKISFTLLTFCLVLHQTTTL